DRDPGDMAAHHRHVTGVIMHAIVLLVGLVVFLVDDDETEIGIGQEQRRARVRGVSSECHSIGRTPKRDEKRSRNWPVSAISGIRINDCLPRRMVSATASK